MKLVKDIEKAPKDSEKISEKEIEEAFIKIIKWIGENPTREGLASTPKRLVKAYKEYFKGYSEDPKKYFSPKSLRTSHGPNCWSGTYSIYSKCKSGWFKQTC